MRSLRHRAIEDERMDAPDLPVETYIAVLNDLSQVNSVTMSRRPTINFLKTAIGARRSFRLLDVGFGQGDMLRTIARWAKRRGIAAELVGVDLNPHSEIVARAANKDDLPIRFHTGDYRDLAGEGFDFVVSSLVAHHMTMPQLQDFLRFMEDQARIGWMINDLHRHILAYLGFPVLSAVMRWHPIVRSDGHLSIARSFRPADWTAILKEAGIDPQTARVVRRFPFRLCVERMR